MYDRLESISLKASASAVDNNLAVRVDAEARKKQSVELAVVHKSVLNVVTTSGARVSDIRRFGAGGSGGAGGGAAAAGGGGREGGEEEEGDTRQHQILVKDPAAAESTNSQVTQVFCS